eukprot:3409708-Rhodomonas_salina.2
MPGIDIAYGAAARYAVRGTDIAGAAAMFVLTKRVVVPGPELHQHLGTISAIFCAVAMPCPVLTCAMLLPV